MEQFTPRRNDTELENSSLVELQQDDNAHQRPDPERLKDKSRNNSRIYHPREKYSQLQNDQYSSMNEPPRRATTKRQGDQDLSRQDSYEDLQRLLDKQAPPVPQGWDYLTLPRRVNLKRVQEPVTKILDDYFEPVRQITYPLAPKGIVYAIGLVFVTLCFTLLSVLVFRWREHSIWFVVGLDVIYSLLFMVLIAKGKAEINEEKKGAQAKCEKQKSKDLKDLEEETKEYEENVKKEFVYFEFINVIRNYSRRLMVRTDMDTQQKKFHYILDEMRDILFQNPKFCVRFLNEEIRNSDIYIEGSEFRRLATVKEIFGTHLALLWMSVKNLRRAQLHGEYSDDDLAKLQSIRKSVLTLTSNHHVITNIMELVNFVLNQDHQRLYTFEEVEQILNNFDCDFNSQTAVKKIKQVQTLYSAMQLFFQRKAGVKKLRKEEESDDDYIGSPQKVIRDPDMVIKFSEIKEKDSPLRVGAQGGRVGRPTGDKRQNENDHEVKTEESNVSAEQVHIAEADDDFIALQQTLQENDDMWEFGSYSENLKVQKRRGMNGQSVHIRCIAILPKIPKQVAFSCYADNKIRKRWDRMIQNFTVVEEDEEKGNSVIYYMVKTPSFIQTRDALLEKKIIKGFPTDGALSIHFKSTTHHNIPEDPTKCLRIDVSSFGMVFEDAPDKMGTKLSWVLHNDIRGCVPKSLINSRALKNPKLMIQELTSACQKLMTNTLL
ncbi:UNKNOWN [Stylonychia lemnae]|uniref:START domain-containing protein n=1 Tax=Stylonychia lemnae TaxID=5949 RepID=A0A078B1G7_STYLE|nr:UNKNOWN [Stylonychia lemnae]|eukprot:CDW87073.1 UNKNOWN [Stylonychia lemnae]